MKEFDRDGYLKKRKKARVMVYMLLPLTLSLIVDIPFPPVPPNINIILAILFFFMSRYYYRTAFSIEEDMKQVPYIALKKEYDGYLTIPVISVELDITIERAEIIVSILEKRGYLTLVKCGTVINENIYKFAGLNFKKPASDDILENV